MKQIFNPQRMEIARARRRLTRRELAIKIGVRPFIVSRWVKTLSEPTDAEVTAIAQVLDWPREFFFLPEVDVPHGMSSFPQ